MSETTPNIPDEKAVPTGLTCGLLTQPERTPVASQKPTFGWVVGGSNADARQTAYQIQISTKDGQEGAIWDSGKVASASSIAVPYGGPELARDSAYRWRVRTWDTRGRESAWSGYQNFKIAGTVPEGFTLIPYPLVQTPVRPTSVIPAGSGVWFADFGRAAFGGLELTLDSANGGETVVVHLGEAREDLHRVHRKPGGSIRYLRAEVTLKAGKHPYIVPLTPKDARRMPPEIGPVMPFRYVEIEGYSRPLTPADARQLVAHYPFDDNAARFTSSDTTLNAVWELCRYTMKATSFCGLYVDGDRERLPYEADAYINQLGHYASDRDFTLARYTHEHLMRHPTWPTEWILFSVLIAWNDYLYSGDAGSLALFYHDLKAKALQTLARPDGLISTVEPPISDAVMDSVHYTPPRARIKDIVDWPAGERDGYEMLPVNTVVNAFHCHALVLMVRIAEALNHPEDATTYRQAAERVTQTFNTKLFDTTTGLYVDGEGSKHSSAHANFFPLAFGLVPAERILAIADFLARKGMVCSVYAAQFLLDALYVAGRGADALRLILAPGDRSWRHMVTDVGTTIALEAWDNRYKPNQDWNHAWGAAPANVIPRGLMGVEPIEPGFKRVRIRPQPGSLTHAELVLPTVRGPIRVAFDSIQTRFQLDLTLPGNTVAEIHLPRLGNNSPHVTLDGKDYEGRWEGDWLVLTDIAPGSHTIVRSGGSA